LFLLDAFFRKTLFSVKYLKKKFGLLNQHIARKISNFSQFGYQSGKTKNGIISSRLSRDNADEKL